MGIISRIFNNLAVWFYPDLKKDLYITNMNYSIETFIKFSFLVTLVFTILFMIPIGYLIIYFNKGHAIAIIMFTVVFVFVMLFLILFSLPRINRNTLGKRIEGEVAVTGRRLLIQLESGKSLINSIINVAKHKKETSKALERMAYELYMGKPLEQAINEAIIDSPSPTFRKIFIQIRNSLKIGSDLKHTLKASLEEITRGKIIEFESFGKKLNPLGLFYMIFGTIGPSLGVVIFVIFLTILNIPIEMRVLTLFLSIIVLIQLFFILIFSKMRPELEI